MRQPSWYRLSRLLFPQGRISFSRIAVLFFFLFANYYAAANQQMVQFSNASTTLFSNQSSGIVGPSDVAIDTSGNIYVVDNNNNRVLKETPSNGIYIQTIVTSDLGNPGDIAIDSSGNLYVTDWNNSRVVKEMPTQGGYTESTIGSGFILPFGVAVDANNNVYISDVATGTIVLETPSAGGYTQSTLLSNLPTPWGIAVDAAGNLYIATRSTEVLKETLSNGSYTQSVITGNASMPYDVMVDGNGTVYIADMSNNRILEETWNSSSGTYVESTMVGVPGPMGVTEDAAGNFYIASYNGCSIVKVQTTTPDFGSQAVRGNTALIILTFVFNQPGSIGQLPVVLTMGATGQDFNDEGDGTCDNNGTSYSYNAGDLCTVYLNFAPLFPGVRNGAVELQDSNGNPLASVDVTGVGIGGTLAFIPPFQSTVATNASVGLSNPVGVALDGNNNLYVADWGNSRVVMLPMSNGAYGTPTSVGNGINNATGVAVDGAGNVYIAGYDGGTVLKETLAAGSYTQSVIGSQTDLPAGVAVDGFGNVYIANYGNGSALVETPSSTSYTESVIASELDSPYGIAVDAAGNVYIADPGDGQILKEAPSNGTYSGNMIPIALIRPQGVTVDAAGDLYVTNTGGNAIDMVPWNGATYGSPLTFGSGLNSPQSLAFDASGNLYIGDSWNNQIVEENFSQTPPLNFGAIPVGQTSNTQSVVVANTGNAPLPFTAISVTSGYNLQTTCSTQSALASGASCSVSVSFTPTASGPLSGDVELDSAVFGQAFVSLSGSGQAAATAAALGFGGSIPNPIANGGNLGTVTVDVLDGSGNVVTGSTATIALQMTGPAGFTAYNTSASALAGIATFNLTSPTLTVAGNYTIAASSTGLTPVQSSFAVRPAPAFGLSLGSSTVTVISGGSGTDNLTITPTGGFTGEVSLSCSNLPSYASCTFSPGSMNADGSNSSLPSVLTLSTDGSVTALIGHRKLPLMFVWWSGVGLFGLFLFPAVKGNWKRAWLVAVLALMSLAFLIGLPGCGSVSHSTQKQQTPPGVYSVTVSASSGGSTHSGVLTLTVN